MIKLKQFVPLEGNIKKALLIHGRRLGKSSLSFLAPAMEIYLEEKRNFTFAQMLFRRNNTDVATLPAIAPREQIEIVVNLA